jgi:hypothetical protein
MSLQHQQDLLARLYTDAEFRRAFLSAPEKIGAENLLNEKEIREIAEIMPEELDFFADSLFWKRLREVEKLLPITRKMLNEEFTSQFREFSQGFNPQTVKKHLEDALGFGRHLQTRNIPQSAKAAARFELSKLEFFGLEKRFVVCRLDFDIREFSASGRSEPAENIEKKKKIAVWIRFGKRIKHFYI